MEHFFSDIDLREIENISRLVGKVRQISIIISGFKYQVKYILKNGNISLMSRHSEYSNTFCLQYRLKVIFFENVNFFNLLKRFCIMENN